jgi:hypothetical protein
MAAIVAGGAVDRGAGEGRTMEEIDGQRLQVLGGWFIRVRRSVVLAVLVVVAALWLLAAVVDGLGAAGSGMGSVTQITVAPAAGAPAR